MEVQKVLNVDYFLKINMFSVYIISSQSTLNKLREDITSCGEYQHIGIIYRTVTRNGVHKKEETNKTIVICPPSTINVLKSKFSHYANNVADYNWSSFPVPSEQKHETWDIHVSGVPNDYSVTDATTFVVKTIHFIIPQYETTDSGTVENYTVNFSPRSRESDKIHGYGIIKFHDHVPHETIKLVKLVLNNSILKFKSSDEKQMVSCVWQRTKRPNYPRHFTERRVVVRERPDNRFRRRPLNNYHNTERITVACN